MSGDVDNSPILAWWRGWFGKVQADQGLKQFKLSKQFANNHLPTIKAAKAYADSISWEELAKKLVKGITKE